MLLANEWKICGDADISLDLSDRYAISDALSYNHRARPLFYRSLAWRDWLDPWKGYKLEGLLLDFAVKECDDPRDKIYGLQGLVKPSDRLQVDYAKSRHEIYADLCNKMYTLHADCHRKRIRCFKTKNR